MEQIQAVKKTIYGTPVYFVKSSEGSKKAWETRRYGGSRKDLTKIKQDHEDLKNKYKDLIEWSRTDSWERPEFSGSPETVKKFIADVQTHHTKMVDAFGKNKTNIGIEEDLGRATKNPNVQGSFGNALSALYGMEDKIRWLNRYLPKEQEKGWKGKERSEASWKELMSKSSEGAKKAWLTRKYGGSHAALEDKKSRESFKKEFSLSDVEGGSKDDVQRLHESLKKINEKIQIDGRGKLSFSIKAPLQKTWFGDFDEGNDTIEIHPKHLEKVEHEYLHFVFKYRFGNPMRIGPDHYDKFGSKRFSILDQKEIPDYESFKKVKSKGSYEDYHKFARAFGRKLFKKITPEGLEDSFDAFIKKVADNKSLDGGKKKAFTELLQIYRNFYTKPGILKKMQDLVDLPVYALEPTELFARAGELYMHGTTWSLDVIEADLTGEQDLKEDKAKNVASTKLFQSQIKGWGNKYLKTGVMSKSLFVIFEKSSEGAKKAWLTRKFGGSHKGEEKPSLKGLSSKAILEMSPEDREKYLKDMDSWNEKFGIPKKIEVSEANINRFVDKPDEAIREYNSIQQKYEIKKKTSVKKTKKSKSKPKPFKMQLVIPHEETERRIHEHLQQAKRESSTTRYLEGRTHDVDIWTKEDLLAAVPKSPKGSQFYAKTNVQNIKRVLEFKKPNEVGGIHTIVVLENGKPVYQYIDTTTEKNSRKKFVRSKNVEKNIGEIRAFYKKGMGKTGYDKQMGTILSLIDLYTIRVGSKADVDEGVRKVEDLKNRALIKAPKDIARVPYGLPYDRNTVYYVFIKDGQRLIGPSERMDEISDEINEARKIKDKAKVETLKQEKKDLVKPMPEDWKEVYKLGHFGATQLEARHVKIEPEYKGVGTNFGSVVHLDFIGKSGVHWEFPVNDTGIAEALADLSKGKSGRDPIFPDVKYQKVTGLLKDNWKCLAKDFRTYHATKTFAEATKDFPVPKTEQELKSIEGQILERVSGLLWNTKGMAKKSYIDPAVYGAWRAGLLKVMMEAAPIKKSLLFNVILEKSVEGTKKAWLTRKYGGSHREQKSYYTTSGAMTMKEFIETEVEDRGNYPLSEVRGWIKKYGIKRDQQIMWVSPKKWRAYSYTLPAEEMDSARDVDESKMDVTEVKGKEGFIIPESDDGSEGFLFVFKN
jgi:hypothetical protein